MLGEPAGESVNQRQVPVHVLVFDERAAHDDLGNQNQRHDVGRRFRIGHDRRNHQTQRHAAHGGHQHDAEIDPKHPADRENVIPDRHKKDALDECEETERNKFRKDVVGQANIQVPLSLEDGAIANDVVRTVR